MSVTRPPERASLMDLARAEREDFAEFLATLTPREWEAPTLCEGWSVQDVVAHVISYDELTGRELVRRLGRGGIRRANAAGVAEYAPRGPEALLALVRAHTTPRGLTAAFGGRIALLDGMIHHQDIRRPLGRPREIPPDRLRAALRFALVAPPVGAFWRARGLRLVPTDLDWTTGRGPEVRGPAEALLLAVAGRRGVVDELSGPGKEKLAGRIR
ncbi:maleylpyruvate isomerase family mycothiol-dependent enzyme [Saccharopolyspora taberi]